MLTVKWIPGFPNNSRNLFSKWKKTYIFSKINKPYKLKHNDVNMTKFNSEQMLNTLSNTSIKPFLNPEKIDQIKTYYRTMNEIVWPYSFVVDEGVAKDIVRKVLTNTTKKDQEVIIEGNPGLGLITINLINSGISKILLFDRSDMQEVSIDQICEKYSDIIIRKASQMQIYSRITILSSFEYCYDNGVPVTLIGVCHTLNFLRTLTVETLKFHLWENKFSIFLVMGDPAWKILTKQSNFKVLKFYLNSLFWVLFSVKEIATYPRSAFLPIGTISNEDMHLIKITYNPNFLKQLQPGDVNGYLTFLNALGSSKNNLIVSTLEHWIPNCGPYLISKGISVENKISELEPQEILLLFTLLKEFDGYQDFSSLASKFAEE